MTSYKYQGAWECLWIVPPGLGLVPKAQDENVLKRIPEPEFFWAWFVDRPIFYYHHSSHLLSLTQHTPVPCAAREQMGHLTSAFSAGRAWRLGKMSRDHRLQGNTCLEAHFNLLHTLGSLLPLRGEHFPGCSWAAKKEWENMWTFYFISEEKTLYNFRRFKTNLHGEGSTVVFNIPNAATLIVP